jgi:hypothetical protein
MKAFSSRVHSHIISLNDVSWYADESLSRPQPGRGGERFMSIEWWLLVLVAAAWAVNRLVGSICDAQENIGLLLADFDRQYPRCEEGAIDVSGRDRPRRLTALRPAL